GASPRGQTSLKVAVGELFATRCATCGRSLVLDEIVWPDQEGPGDPTDAAADPVEPLADADPDEPRPADDGGATAVARKVYACPVCRGQRGGEQRTADLDAADLARARAVPPDHRATRARLRDRFPVVEGGTGLVDGLLDLHTPRQLAGLEA